MNTVPQRTNYLAVAAVAVASFAGGVLCGLVIAAVMSSSSMAKVNTLERENDELIATKAALRRLVDDLKTQKNDDDEVFKQASRTARYNDQDWELIGPTNFLGDNILIPGANAVHYTNGNDCERLVDVDASKYGYKIRDHQIRYKDRWLSHGPRTITDFPNGEKTLQEYCYGELQGIQYVWYPDGKLHRYRLYLLNEIVVDREWSPSGELILDDESDLETELAKRAQEDANWKEQRRELLAGGDLATPTDSLPHEWTLNDSEKKTKTFNITTNAIRISWQIHSVDTSAHISIHRDDGKDGGQGSYIDSLRSFQDDSSIVRLAPGRYYFDLSSIGGETEFKMEEY